MTYATASTAPGVVHKVMMCDGPWCTAMQPVEPASPMWHVVLSVNEVGHLDHRHFHRLICLAAWATRELLRRGPGEDAL